MILDKHSTLGKNIKMYYKLSFTVLFGDFAKMDESDDGLMEKKNVLHQQGESDNRGIGRDGKKEERANFPDGRFLPGPVFKSD